MSRRPAPGRSPAQEADAAFDEEGRPSKSQRKRESHALQTLGDDLAALPASRLNALELPESLREAIRELHRTRSHEGRRRQTQFIGKLMRQVDPQPLQEAVVGALVYGKQLVVSYTGLMLTMDMFPQVGGPSMHPSCDGLEGCGNVTPLRRGSFQEAAGRIEGCGRIFSRERRQERSK